MVPYTDQNIAERAKRRQGNGKYAGLNSKNVLLKMAGATINPIRMPHFSCKLMLKTASK